MNNVSLIGRMTKDPELKYTGSGVPVTSFTLAVNRQFTNAQGERETDFIQCQVWRKPAENTANFCKKGSLVGVTGRIQTRNYDGQDGKRVFVTEVVAESVQFLDTRSNGQNVPDLVTNNQPNINTRQQQNDPFTGQIDVSDDDLPF